MKAIGINKKVSYLKESTWGDIAGPAGAKQVRRTTADFTLTKDSYGSEELRTDYMVADNRHGVKNADGTLNGELSPGTYADFFGSVLARDFAIGATEAAAEVTIAVSGINYTITRADVGADFLAEGFKVGTVVRLTGAGLSTANVGNNLLILGLTATVATVKVLSSTALVAEGPIAAVGITTVGKTTFVPKTGHTDDSYTVEQWYGDIAQSEVYTGMKVGTANVSLPATGIITTDFTFMGKDLAQTGVVEYFTTPAAAGTTGILTAVQGAVIIDGVAGSQCITDMSLSITRNMTPAQCLGSDSNSDIFVGRIEVSGSMSVYLSDASLRDKFKNEVPISVVVAATTGEDKDDDFITFVLPKVKVNSFSAADSTEGIVASVDFVAILNDVTTGGLVDSVILINDSQA